jgi:hypothetical protein
VITQNISSVGGELNTEPVEYGAPIISHTITLYTITPNFLKSILILSPYQGLILPTELLSSYFPNIISRMFVILFFLDPSLDLFKMTIQKENIGTRRQNSARQTSTIITSTKELYMQPHTHNDCTRDCNVERIYFIVKRQNILIIL